jgi:hypothetical protein
VQRDTRYAAGRRTVVGVLRQGDRPVRGVMTPRGGLSVVSADHTGGSPPRRMRRRKQYRDQAQETSVRRSGVGDFLLVGTAGLLGG